MILLNNQFLIPLTLLKLPFSKDDVLLKDFVSDNVHDHLGGFQVDRSKEALKNHDGWMEDVSNTLQQMQEKEDNTTEDLINLKNVPWVLDIVRHVSCDILMCFFSRCAWMTDVIESQGVHHQAGWQGGQRCLEGGAKYLHGLVLDLLFLLGALSPCSSHLDRYIF